jgi:hypothetical protein
MQWDACKSSLIGEEGTELPKGPRAMLRTLRPSNRAIGAFPNVPKVFYRYSLSSIFGLLNNPFGDHMISIMHTFSFRVVSAREHVALLQKGEHTLELPIQLALF